MNSSEWASTATDDEVLWHHEAEYSQLFQNGQLRKRPAGGHARPAGHDLQDVIDLSSSE